MFTVRLRGGVERVGALVSVEVVRPQRTTFVTRPTGRDGRAVARHRFRYTVRPTTYAFRAKVQRQPGLPYEPATSRVVRLRVRP